MKIDVEKTLPPKKEIYIYVGLTELQQEMYKTMLVKRAVISEISKQSYLNIMMQVIFLKIHQIFDFFHFHQNSSNFIKLLIFSDFLIKVDKNMQSSLFIRRSRRWWPASFRRALGHGQWQNAGTGQTAQETQSRKPPGPHLLANDLGARYPWRLLSISKI